jgi:hypothetical protein
MFIIHPRQFRSLTIKLSLQGFINYATDEATLMLSIMNRQHNKQVVLGLSRDLIMNRRLSLISISKLFNKFNSVYKQASIERA